MGPREMDAWGSSARGSKASFWEEVWDAKVRTPFQCCLGLKIGDRHVQQQQVTLSEAVKGGQYKR